MPTMKSVQTAAPGTVQIAESEEAFAVTARDMTEAESSNGRPEPGMSGTPVTCGRPWSCRPWRRAAGNSGHHRTAGTDRAVTEMQGLGGQKTA
jgi:hypothetical protein